MQTMRRGLLCCILMGVWTLDVFALKPLASSASRRARIQGDQPGSFTLESPVSEEEMVEIMLFGFRLADVVGVSAELHGDDGARSSRRLEPVPRRGSGFVSELRWSLCGAARTTRILVWVHWKTGMDTAAQNIRCQVDKKNVLLRDGAEWNVRLSSVAYRRLPWEGRADGPASVVIRSPEATAAVACVRQQCIDDSKIEPLAVDDACQEFTDCLTFEIQQGRPSYLYIRPRGSGSDMIGKLVHVSFGAGPPAAWNRTEQAASAAAECRHQRLGVSRTPPPPQPGRQVTVRPTNGPVKVLVKTSVTVYRPQQTQQTQIQQTRMQQTQQTQQTQRQQTQQTQQPQQQQGQQQGQQQTEGGAGGGAGQSEASSESRARAPNSAAGGDISGSLLVLCATIKLLYGL